MRLHPALAIALATLATGCIVVDDDRPGGVVNYAPEILDADAGCYWDSYYYDDIWYFEAAVDDLDGPRDVEAVWADVYDEWSGDLVESFELYPTNDPHIWFSDWLGSSTWLDCMYYDYTVDIVAYDSFDDSDWVTVIPYQE